MIRVKCTYHDTTYFLKQCLRHLKDIHRSLTQQRFITTRQKIITTRQRIITTINCCTVVCPALFYARHVHNGCFCSAAHWAHSLVDFRAPLRVANAVWCGVVRWIRWLGSRNSGGVESCWNFPLCVFGASIVLGLLVFSSRLGKCGYSSIAEWRRFPGEYSSWRVLCTIGLFGAFYSCCVFCWSSVGSSIGRLLQWLEKLCLCPGSVRLVPTNLSVDFGGFSWATSLLLTGWSLYL